MRLLTCLIVFAALSACVTTPPEDPWANLTVDMEPAAQPINCGDFPLPAETTNETATYDKAGFNSLERYMICSEANADLVIDHADQIAELKIVRKELTGAGQAQRHIASMRQEMLEDERQHNFWTTIGYWVVIVGLAVAL